MSSRIGIKHERAFAGFLAKWVFGWKLARDRYIKANGQWIPKWRFEPLHRLDDTFARLDKAADRFTVDRTNSGILAVEVEAGGHVGRAPGKPNARAVASALGIDTGSAA